MPAKARTSPVRGAIATTPPRRLARAVIAARSTGIEIVVPDSEDDSAETDADSPGAESESDPAEGEDPAEAELPTDADEPDPGD